MKLLLARRFAFPLAMGAVLACASLAVAASPTAGSYKGKIKFQGYDITFKVKGAKVTKLVARMLQDCDGDGSSESFLIAPGGSFKIGKGGKVDSKRIDVVGKSKATVLLKGTFSGSKFKGYVREYDFVSGSGIVCDTKNRKFTAAPK